MQRVIVHVDMDAFFAAIEQRDRPACRGRPVVVGADPREGKGRGVVATCSYEARAFGIHSAMPISFAWRACPEAFFLPVDMEKYSRVAEEIFSLLRTFSPVIEPVSIDEAFLDITGSYHLFKTPYHTCLGIKEKIRKETGLTASVGCAPIKMAAKIASDIKKPDGLVCISKSELTGFLWPLPVGKLWGVGEKTGDLLLRNGFRTIGDIARRHRKELISLLGANGEYLWELARGKDERPVEWDEGIKSVSHEFTFEQDTADDERINAALMGLCEKISQRLRRQKLQARTITLKVRLEGFSTFTRSLTLSEPTDFVHVIFKTARQLYRDFARGKEKIRLVGVRTSNFSCRERQYTLFGKEDKQEHIHQAVDRLKEKFGDTIIGRASRQNLFGEDRWE